MTGQACMPGPRRSAPHLLTALVEGQRTLDAHRSVRIEFGDAQKRDALRQLTPDDYEHIAEAAAETARRLRREQQRHATLELEL